MSELTRCPEPVTLVIDAIFLPCAGSTIAFCVSSGLDAASARPPQQHYHTGSERYVHEVAPFAKYAVHRYGGAKVLQPLEAVNTVLMIYVPRCFLHARARKRDPALLVGIGRRWEVA